jgi:hypothetical protein
MADGLVSDDSDSTENVEIGRPGPTFCTIVLRTPIKTAPLVELVWTPTSFVVRCRGTSGHSRRS